MRVYIHFEEEEPNHTAVLTAAGPETTLDDLLEDFLRSYLDHYGEGAADLDADAVELRSSKCAPQPARACMCGCCIYAWCVWNSAWGAVLAVFVQAVPVLPLQVCAP